MPTVNVKEWEVYVTINRKITLPYDGETEKEMVKWLRSLTGKEFALANFIKGARVTYPTNVEIDYQDLWLREHEVKSTDTDPRV